MTLYYFLGTLLPDLKMGQKPEIGFVETLSLLKGNLTEKDALQVETFLRLIDIENLRQLWAGRPLVQMGNYDENELQEEVGLPSDLLNYLDHFKETSDRIKNYASLLASFFKEAIPQQKGFLKAWLIQEKNQRLVLTALRAKKMGRPILEELQHEELDDPLIADIMAQKDAPKYTPPLEYKEISALYEEHQDHPLKLQKAFLEYQFKQSEKMASLNPFTIDRMIRYLFQLYLVEKSLKLGAA